MRYRLMASFRGAAYQAGVGPSDEEVTLFAACPPPEEHGFRSSKGHWRRQVSIDEIDALWESRPIGRYRGERCMVLDDLGDRLHIAYLGQDLYTARRLGFWEVDRGVFEVVVPRQEIDDLREERSEFELVMLDPFDEPVSEGPRDLPGWDASGAGRYAPAPRDTGPAARGARPRAPRDRGLTDRDLTDRDLTGRDLTGRDLIDTGPSRVADPGAFGDRARAGRDAAWAGRDSAGWAGDDTSAQDPRDTGTWAAVRDADFREPPEPGGPFPRRRGGWHVRDTGGWERPDTGSMDARDVAAMADREPGRQPTRPAGRNLADTAPWDARDLAGAGAWDTRDAAPARQEAARLDPQGQGRWDPQDQGRWDPQDTVAWDPVNAGEWDPPAPHAGLPPAGALPPAGGPPAVTARPLPTRTPDAAAVWHGSPAPDDAGLWSPPGPASPQSAPRLAIAGRPAADPPSGEYPAMSGRPAGRRSAQKARVTTQQIFAQLLELASIPQSAYAVDEEVDGAMCLIRTNGGYQVFSVADQSRHEVRFFDDEEAAYFYLFGILAAEAVRSGHLGPQAPYPQRHTGS
jgi:hypothetical protein